MQPVAAVVVNESMERSFLREMRFESSTMLVSTVGRNVIRVIVVGSKEERTAKRVTRTAHRRSSQCRGSAWIDQSGL